MSPVPAFHPPARTLMGPGPSPVSPDVLAALAKPTLGHLDPVFVGLMDEVKGLLQQTFRTENRLTMPVSGPGTAGMEGTVSNLVEPGTTVVVCRNGVFGERLRQMVERVGGVAVMVETEWGRAVDPDDLRQTLAATPGAEVVAFVHAETSTGALSDAAALAAVAREHECLTICDTVTSLGGVPVEVDAWGLDAVYSGTQKCLSAPPGLSPVTYSDRALDRVRQRATPVASWFLDVSLVAGYWDPAGGTKRAYHHTAPVNMIYALHEALRRLQAEGLEAAWARHAQMHAALAAGLDALGLEFIVPAGERLPQLNAVYIPEGVDDADTRRQLLDGYGLEIGGGLGDLAGKAWRIGLMGEGARPETVRLCLGALGEVLGRDGALGAAEPLLAEAVTA